MKPLSFLLVFFVLAGVSFAQDAKEKKVLKAGVDKDNIQRIEIVGGSYFFNPDYIIVKVNVPVELTIKKEPGVAPHDIAINAPEAGIDFKEAMGSEPKVVKFTPAKTGKYPIYCSKRFLFFKNHREKGMEGILEVID